jgi:hypothetical protein
MLELLILAAGMGGIRPGQLALATIAQAGLDLSQAAPNQLRDLARRLVERCGELGAEPARYASRAWKAQGLWS